MLLSERNQTEIATLSGHNPQSEMATCFLAPIMQHSRKGKTTKGTELIIGYQAFFKNRWTKGQSSFRVVKLFCMIQDCCCIHYESVKTH